MNTETSFGAWVRRRRKALDLTQQELAQRVGCSISLIFKIEADERRPSRQVAELLAKYLEISPDQRDLFLKIARQERAVDSLDALTPQSTSGLAPVPQPLQSNLPLPLTPLLGREHELQAILRQIQDPACRLLTLTGPGGIGKTRLALEVAHRLRDSFEHGTGFISLVGTSSSEFIAPAMADALGFSFSGTNELKAQLFNFLRGKHTLLVLDNLEHLLDGVELLDELLERTPDVKLLTTSREQLNLRAEWSFEVQGLPIPSNIELDHLESYSAAALFTQRAIRAKRDFTPTANQLDAIKRICQLVEGSPLGLELAATWVRMMSVQEIAHEIERSVDFLTTAARGAPQRHRSMRAVFDYSWNLLSDEERRALMHLSVFRGGFTRTAAEKVAGATLHHLSALVHKSLLRHNEDQAGRYDFHELIRQYAALKLQEDAEESNRAQDRHAGHFASWLHLQEPRLEGSQLQEALTQIGLEIDNLHHAWDWMVAHRQISNLQESLASLFILHDIRNWIRQGAALFEQAVTALQAHENVDENEEARVILLGELMTCQGHICWHLGDIQKARDLLQGGLQLLGAHRDRAMLAEVLLYLSVMEHSQGDYEAARQFAEECVSLNRAQERASGTGYALSNLGVICLTQGEYKTAYTYLKESIHVMRSIEHSRGTAISLTRLGVAAIRLCRLDEAQQFLDEGLEITRRFNDRWGIGNALCYLGMLAFARGNMEHAEALIRESVTLFREDSDQISLASTLAELGHVLNERNAESDSWVVFRQVLQIAMRVRALPAALYALAGIAPLLMKAGTSERAYELVMYVLWHPSSNQQTKERAEKLRVILEPQITPEQIETVRSRLQSMTLEVWMQELANS